MPVHQLPDSHLPWAEAHVLHQGEGTGGGKLIFIVVELFAYLLLIDDIPINYSERLLNIQLLPDTTRLQQSYLPRTYLLPTHIRFHCKKISYASSHSESSSTIQKI